MRLRRILATTLFTLLGAHAALQAQARAVLDARNGELFVPAVLGGRDTLLAVSTLAAQLPQLQKRGADPGVLLDAVSRPIEVRTWTRNGNTFATAFNVTPVLAGLTLRLDAAQLGPRTSVRVNGKEAPLDELGQLTVCSPCTSGQRLDVAVDAGTLERVAPPLLHVREFGWADIRDAAAFAHTYVDSAAVRPSARVAGQLLTALLQPDKKRYFQLIEQNVARLAPHSVRARADTIFVFGTAVPDADAWRAATNLLQRFPESHFAAADPGAYQALEASDRDLLQRIRALEHAGRWTVLAGTPRGGMQMPGEAFARALADGQRTLTRLFGHPARVARLDASLLPPSAPQLLLSAGINAVVLPRPDSLAAGNVFWWQGNAGARVLALVADTSTLGTESLGALWARRRGSDAAGDGVVAYRIGYDEGASAAALERKRAFERLPVTPAVREVSPERIAQIERMKATTAPVLTGALDTRGSAPRAGTAASAWREHARTRERETADAIGASAMIAALDTRPRAAGARTHAVLNVTGRSRSGVVAIDVPGRPAESAAWSADGRRLPAVRRGDTLFVAARDFGPGVNLLFTGAAKTMPPVRACLQRSCASATSRILENDHVRVEIDPRTGAIRRLYHRKDKHDALKRGEAGNALVLVDTAGARSVLGNASVSPIETTPLGASVTVRRSAPQGTVVQRYFLGAGADRVDVETTVEAPPTTTRLEIALPLARAVDTLWLAGPYSVIQRTVTDTARTGAAQEWLDAYHMGYGLAFVLPDAFEYRATRDALILSLSARERRFTYSLVPHIGDFSSGPVQSASLSLAQPLQAVGVTAHAARGRSASFVTLGEGSVDVTAMRRSADGRAVVLRVAETAGNRTITTLRFDQRMRVVRADLLEKPGDVVGTGTMVRVTLAPFEVQTLLVTPEPARTR